jgi:RNA polymerase sigma-70 factor, ECF subfamily
MRGWQRPVDTAVVARTGARAHNREPRSAAVGVSEPADDPPDGSATGDDALVGALAGARRGDGEAFRVLYRETQPRLLRYLRALVGEDAEDVASETWLHIARDLHGFAGEGDSGVDGFRGWAATIARHRALDHLRRQARRPPPVLVPADDLAWLAAGDDTAAAAVDAVSTDAAVRLIASLPRDQAEAVLLRVVLGLDAARAAAVLGKRPGAVRTAAYRGLRTLARHLEQPGEC